MLDCSTCGHRAPRCDRCLDAILAHLRGVAEVRGMRWGELVRAKASGRAWPVYGEDERVTAMARARVADLGGEDERLLEQLARICCAGAAKAYGKR